MRRAPHDVSGEGDQRVSGVVKPHRVRLCGVGCRTMHPRIATLLDAPLDEQARVWLTAARRWLRRGGGIGLASLVWRPGFASLTPTHADIHFRVNDSDMRVRTLGLDIDPGWLPWFGRVVSFHYEEPLR